MVVRIAVPDPEKLRTTLVRALTMRWTERMGHENTSVESIERLVDEVLDTMESLGYLVGEPAEDA